VPSDQYTAGTILPFITLPGNHLR